jgi:1-acyl-sn-glycerol-3-phosphate acyltransferase
VRAARASGSSILIFPQGTHTSREAELADDPSIRFRTGVAHLAEALESPVVPFGLAGPERMMPPVADAFHGVKIGGVPVSIRPGPLAIAFGAPLRLEPGEPAGAFAARLQAVCYALARQAEDATSGAISASAGSSASSSEHSVPKVAAPTP